MRRILLGLALFSVLASVAYAAGGSANAPLYVRPWQGDTRDFKEVTCPTGGDTALVTAAEAANAMSIYFFNTAAPTSAIVTICPRAAGTGQCNDATDGITLPVNAGYTSNVSVAGPWSCDGTGGSTVVEVYIERDYGTSPNPTPTPLT